MRAQLNTKEKTIMIESSSGRPINNSLSLIKKLIPYNDKGSDTFNILIVDKIKNYNNAIELPTGYVKAPIFDPWQPWYREIRLEGGKKSYEFIHGIYNINI